MRERDFRDYRKRKLSESDKGIGLKVTGTTAPGQIIHWAVDSSAANEFDEVWIKALNQSASPVTLTIQWGWTRTEDQIKVTLPANSALIDVVPGLVLNGAAGIYAFASAANVVVVHGFVHRYQLTE
ncbi:MAG: hypothetical protein L6Q98_21275 [Anaerolineae bacterium]|nr:hypothetical protein [Anaerolineae bacterium]NUQ06120.1 hypothetical protein [Anaerolineae bacterium]